MSILNEMELGTLKGMAIYWREVFERDDQAEHYCIANYEFNRVVRLLGPEKVLRIIAEYVGNINS